MSVFNWKQKPETPATPVAPANVTPVAPVVLNTVQPVAPANDPVAPASNEPSISDVVGMIGKLANSVQTLSTGIEEDKRNNSIYTKAISMNVPAADAANLSNDPSMTYEQKLEALITNAASFSAEAMNVLTANAPVGSIPNGGNVPVGTPAANAPKNSSEAVLAVKKEFGIKGMEAVNKAKLMFPDVFNKRMEHGYNGGTGSKIDLEKVKGMKDNNVS